MNLKSELIQENDRIRQLVQTIKTRYTITEIPNTTGSTGQNLNSEIRETEHRYSLRRER